MLVLKEYGSRDNFLRIFSPSLQMDAAKNEERAFFGRAPQLGLLKHAYGESFPTMWLMPQLFDLCEFTNSRGKLSDDMIEQLAGIISQEYGHMKVTELLVFFYRFKCGRYGRFYGSVDPIIIMNALDDFRGDRDRIIEAHRKVEEKRQEARESKLPAIKPEEWCRSQGLPECHSAIEAWQIVNRIINHIEALVWCLGFWQKTIETLACKAE